MDVPRLKEGFVKLNYSIELKRFDQIQKSSKNLVCNLKNQGTTVNGAFYVSKHAIRAILRIRTNALQLTLLSTSLIMLIAQNSYNHKKKKDSFYSF